MQGFEPTASTSEWYRIGAAFGVLSVVVSLSAIAAAILIADQFSWTSNALSDLGRASWNSTAVFNAGLIVTGLLALPFGAVLLSGAETMVHALGAAVFLVAAICLSLIGVFALPAPRHGTVAVGFFVGFTVALFVYGVGDVRSGARTRRACDGRAGRHPRPHMDALDRCGRAGRGCDPRNGRFGVSLRVDARNRGPTPVSAPGMRRVRFGPSLRAPSGP